MAVHDALHHMICPRIAREQTEIRKKQGGSIDALASKRQSLHTAEFDHAGTSPDGSTRSIRRVRRPLCAGF